MQKLPDNSGEDLFKSKAGSSVAFGAGLAYIFLTLKSQYIYHQNNQYKRLQVRKCD